MNRPMIQINWRGDGKGEVSRSTIPIPTEHLYCQIRVDGKPVVLVPENGEPVRSFLNGSVICLDGRNGYSFMSTMQHPGDDKVQLVRLSPSGRLPMQCQTNQLHKQEPAVLPRPRCRSADRPHRPVRTPIG